MRQNQRHHPAFANDHPYLPLGFAYEMRNALSHGYFKVDLEIVWKTITIENRGAIESITDGVMCNLLLDG